MALQGDVLAQLVMQQSFESAISEKVALRCSKYSFYHSRALERVARKAPRDEGFKVIQEDVLEGRDYAIVERVQEMLDKGSSPHDIVQRGMIAAKLCSPSVDTPLLQQITLRVPRCSQISREPSVFRRGDSDQFFWYINKLSPTKYRLPFSASFMGSVAKIHQKFELYMRKRRDSYEESDAKIQE